MGKRVYSAGACAFAILLLSATAQTPAYKPDRAGAPPVLRTTTHLVQVSVVVRGKRNEPVDDLKKDDFTIYDNGQRQEIAAFSLESAGIAPEERKGTLPRNTFTNRAELRPKAPDSVTMILLDGLNTKFEDQVYAKEQLIRYLGQLQPVDRVAVYTLRRELRVVHDFTIDSSSILRALGKYKSRSATGVSDSNPAQPDMGADDMDRWLREADQTSADFQTVNRVQRTLAAVEAIANHVTRIPGRKNLIWISGEFPLVMEMESTARALEAANLAIYPVAAPGSSNPAATPRDNMQGIAERSGGKVFYGSNALKNAIRAAIDDARASYMLSYYPRHNHWDGKFRELTVQVDRKGVDVRHRLGYFAFPDRPLTDKDKKAAFEEALWSPLEADRLGVTVRVAPNAPRPGKLRVMILVDAKNVQLEQKDGRWMGRLEILFARQSAANRPPTLSGDSMDFDLKSEEYRVASQRGLALARDLDLPEARYQLKVAVRDTGSGNLGTVIIPVRSLPDLPAPGAKR